MLRNKWRQLLNFMAKYRRKNRETLNVERFAKRCRFFVANKTCARVWVGTLQFCHISTYSNDWDWATRSQSEDRVHRMGQTENVHIVDIYAEGTIDERNHGLFEQERKLSGMVQG